MPRNSCRFFLLAALVAGCGATPAPAPSPPPVATAAHVAPFPAPPVTPSTRVSTFPEGWPYPADVAPVVGKQGMVVTDAAIATKVGVEVLASGGNAVDAAVATAFALAVVYPAAGNLGGGGFMVARMDGASKALDFRETAPAAATRGMFLGPDGKPLPEAREGYRASGVPGSVAGLWEAHHTLGSKKKTWAELLAPAIKLADEGFLVDESFSSMINQAAKRLAPYPASMALFFPGGAPPAVGSTWKNPDLAAVLRRIAEKGPAGFYQGPTADLLAAEMRAGKGLISKADLAGYKSVWRTPIEFDYRGNHIVSMPPPSSGGVTLAMMCHILEGYDLRSSGWQTAPSLHLVFEAMRRGFAARNARLGDPDFVKNPLNELLSPAWAQAQRATIRPDRATPSSEIVSAGPSGGDGPHTTHFSVVDAQGNAVALTTTLNWWFGNGVTVRGAGFLLNNEMDDFAAVPGTQNGFGLVQGEPNAVAPRKRMLSSMSPTIVTDADGKVKLVLGAAGGPTIITAVFDTLSNVVDYGLDVTTAAYAPRFHMQHQPDVVMFEASGIRPDTKKALEGMGYTFKEREHIADAPALGRGADGWIGVAEIRRKGTLAAGR